MKHIKPSKIPIEKILKGAIHLTDVFISMTIQKVFSFKFRISLIRHAQLTKSDLKRNEQCGLFILCL